MKNLSLVLNIVLLIAVIALYVLFFTGSKSAIKSSSADTTVIGDVKIAYINSDSVLKYYNYFKQNSEKLETKSKKLKDDYRQRAMGLQSEFSNYQRSVNSMTYGQVKAAEDDLAKKQQNLQMYEQSLTQELMREEQQLTMELYERITKFIRKYSTEKGIHLVLKFDPTSDVLYGNAGIDITQDVIKGLNEDYQADSTTAASPDAGKK
jgi:outer membrane protein